MGDSSPTKLMFSGMLVAFLSIKLRDDYLYISYAAIALGILFFLIGIIKYFKQRNKYY